MKYKFTAILLIIFSLCTCSVYAQDKTALGETLTLNVNDMRIDIYSYKIDGEYYFMLRDIACMLNDTDKKINIGWDNGKNQVNILKDTQYENTGNELKVYGKNTEVKPIASSTNIYFDETKVDITVYEINESNCLKLQDIMILMDIYMLYDENNRLTGIDTSLPYDKNTHLFYPGSNVSILLYHHFTDDTPSKDQYYISVSKEKFENDIKQLLENGFFPLSLENYYLNRYDKNKKYFVLTFDDGYLSNYDIAYPILKKHNVYADIFINTDNIYMDHHFKLNQAKEMEDSGLVKIYSHYPIHIDVRNVVPEEYTSMLKKSVETLETELDKKDFYFFAYPYGYYNEEKYNLTNDAGFKLQMIQTITYDNNRLIKRYNVPHITNIKNLVEN